MHPQGKPHFRNIKMGLSEEEVQQALDHYRAKAAQNAYAGCAAPVRAQASRVPVTRLSNKPRRLSLRAAVQR